jgi:hypothetical protein
MSEILKVPGSDDEVVLLDYLNDPGVHDNLFRVRPTQEVVWRVTPPGDDPDGWTEARIEGDMVIARSWSDYVVRFDVETGKELSREFIG